MMSHWLPPLFTVMVQSCDVGLSCWCQAGVRRAALAVSTSVRVVFIHNVRGSTIYQILCSNLWSHEMPRGPVVCGSSLEDL